MIKLNKKSVLLIIEGICLVLIAIVCIVDLASGIEGIINKGVQGKGFKLVKTFFSDIVTNRKGTYSSFYKKLATNGIIGCGLGLLVIVGLVYAEIKEKKVPLDFVIALLVAIANFDMWLLQQMSDGNLRSFKDFHFVSLIASLIGLISAIILCRMEMNARKRKIIQEKREKTINEEQ